MLTMFGMVLAIGILVDDAIVVVENVERIMAEEGLPPKEAARKAMSQITSAIVGITLVLMAVFVPMAFFPGSVGIIYRQFSVTVVFRDRLLRADGAVADAGAVRHAAETGEGRTRPRPQRLVRLVQSRAGGRAWPLCLDRRLVAEANRTPDADLRFLVGGLVWAFVRLPAGFLPVDDQGFITTDVQTPADSSHGRTETAVEAVERYLAKRPGIARCHFPYRFCLFGAGHEHGASVYHPEGLVGAA